KGRTIFRAIFFLPMVVAPAAIAMVWKWIFNTQYGILNSILGQNIGWLTTSQFVLLSCAVVQIWSNIGYDAVLLLAGLQNVSPTLYEAADLDGASKTKQFFHITLPMVSPTLFVVLIMRLMSSMKVFDLIYMMVDDANPVLNDAQSLMSLFYRESFIAGDKGYASAIVVWTVLLIGAVTVVQFIGQKKWVNYEV
ncbi:MAG: sugar ABC transporter permease, partial [Candidatus Fournierella pullistercoris]|nr:sugar ABC transporter permease [Candidatus Fournierella pullistercoris]